ncbi:ribbon-helix-helix protein, CopG family [Mycobacterium sp. M1]|uniref:Ribbon-helix-helix protein, CopG family n=1 Tax=Mycolicibacter acidiphilus TaxID=2835306 RepID=A0ABS5RR87_9MYCO|nr:ribbon-helix-helix protein, CopG family [Mycolicibacter acidiphilus]MBS9535474.1 ribbon-helix-helix protein, CopG family [Mycolicibacter acidiphilus]
MGKSIEQTLNEEAALAEATKDDLDVAIPSHVKISRGGPRTRVLQVRLNDDELAGLEEWADKRGLPASTLVREMILNVLQPVPAQAAARQRLVGEFQDYLDRLYTADRL